MPGFSDRDRVELVMVVMMPKVATGVHYKCGGVWHQVDWMSVCFLAAECVMQHCV